LGEKCKSLQGVTILDLPRVIGVIVQLSDVPGRVKSLSPPPGKHPNEILQKPGYK